MHTHTHISLYTFLQSCIHTFTHSHIPTFIYPYNDTFIHSYIATFTHPNIHTLMRLYIHTSLQSYTHTFKNSYIPTFIYSYAHIHSCIRTFIHRYILNQEMYAMVQWSLNVNLHSEAQRYFNINIIFIYIIDTRDRAHCMHFMVQCACVAVIWWLTLCVIMLARSHRHSDHP